MRLSKLFVSATIVSAASLAFAVRAADVESLPDKAAPEEQEILQCQSDLRAFEDELAQAGCRVALNCEMRISTKSTAVLCP